MKKHLLLLDDDLNGVVTIEATNLNVQVHYSPSKVFDISTYDEMTVKDMKNNPKSFKLNGSKLEKKQGGKKIKKEKPSK